MVRCLPISHYFPKAWKQ